MPYTSAARRFFFLCSSASGRAKARSKCPPQATAHKLAHEAASLPTKPAKKRR